MAPRTKQSKQQQQQPPQRQRSNKKSNKASRRRSTEEDDDSASSSSKSSYKSFVLPPALLAAVGFAAFKYGQASVRDLPPIRPTDAGAGESAPTEGISSRPAEGGDASAVVVDSVSSSSFAASSETAASSSAANAAASPFWSLLCPPEADGGHDNATLSSSSSDDRYCHPNLDLLAPPNDPRVSSSDVNPGDKLVTIPRKLQIRDVDALSDEYVQSELLTNDEKDPLLLESGALLACHLIRRLKIGRKEWTPPPTSANASEASVEFESKMTSPRRKRRTEASVDADGRVQVASSSLEKREEEDVLLPYLESLPSHTSLLASHHPVFLPSDQLDSDDLLGNRRSSSRIAIEALKTKIRTEYSAIVSKSNDFGANVNEEEYVAMRINIERSSFPIEEADCYRDAEGRESHEAYAFRDREGSPGLSCVAMVPLLDATAGRRHASSNAEWEYSGKDGSFVIKAGSSGIQAKRSVVVSDGIDGTTNPTAAELYAVAGRIPGSASTLPSSASIAAHHTIISSSSEVTEEQSKQLMEYLRYDDGYIACLNPKELGRDEMRVLTLKKLKHTHLKRIANDESRWTIVFPPVETDKEVEDTIGPHPPPPTYTADQIEEMTENVTSTCRLLSLTHEDYDGHAVKILEAVLNHDNAESFLVGKQTNALEFRTMVCLSRLVDGMMNRYPTNSVQERKHVQSLIKHNSDTPEFYAAQLRLSELQILESLRYAWGVAGQEAKDKAKDEPQNPIPDTWRELVDPKSGWPYYQRLTSPTGTWIRPIMTAREAYEKQQRDMRGDGKKKALPDPTSTTSVEENKPKSAKRPDLLARRKPCDLDLTADVINKE